jgi:hypothetical protein
LSYDPFFRADAGARQHRLDRLSRDVRPDGRKIPIRHFEDLRAIIPSRAQLLFILSKSSQKHKFPFVFQIRPGRANQDPASPNIQHHKHYL